MPNYISEYGVYGAFQHMKDKILWLFDSHKFKHCGKHIYISYPNQISGHKYISLGEGVVFRQRLQLEAISRHNGHNYSPNIEIGDRVSINNDVHIAAIDSVVIGDDVLIASKVYISDHSHGNTIREDVELPPSKRDLYTKGPVIIEKCVWIGEGVAVMPGVRIGRNSIIGANSVVTKNVPEFSVVAGCPARVIKYLER